MKSLAKENIQNLFNTAGNNTNRLLMCGRFSNYRKGSCSPVRIFPDTCHPDLFVQDNLVQTVGVFPVDKISADVKFLQITQMIFFMILILFGE